jgi:hypothetical protein
MAKNSKWTNSQTNRFFRTLLFLVVLRTLGEDSCYLRTVCSQKVVYRQRQSNLVKRGVVKAALNAIATHPSNVAGNLADEASACLLELVRE